MDGSPLLHAVFDLWFAEEVFAGVFGDEAELFELVVGALDFAFVDGKFLAERRGGGKGFAGGDGLVANVRFDLLAHLDVDGVLGAIFEFDVHR